MGASCSCITAASVHWDAIRRKVEALIPDALYSVAHRDNGFGGGVSCDPRAPAPRRTLSGALTRTVERIAEMVRQSGKPNAFRFTSALTDGETLYAVRYALPKETANTLYFREDGEDVVVASEPLDAERSFWTPVPANHLLVVPKRGKSRLEPFLDEARVAAA